MSLYTPNTWSRVGKRKRLPRPTLAKGGIGTAGHRRIRCNIEPRKRPIEEEFFICIFLSDQGSFAWKPVNRRACVWEIIVFSLGVIARCSVACVLFKSISSVLL